MARTRIGEEARRAQILEAAFVVAREAGIDNLTVRGVAAQAGVSHALVLFHFGRKDKLVRALLDWVLAGTSVLRVSDDIAHFPHARDRLHAVLEQEMTRLSHQPEQFRLFLEFWAMGARNERIRERISAELELYRASLRTIMEELLAVEPGLFPGATADALAAVAVSWINGCAVQAMVDPARFDTDDYMAALRGMIAGPGGAGAPALGRVK
jgi:TetR/AcrR family transcriptional regulator, transcriptional repressor of bet genes